jgi:hypothetical protein
MRFSRLAYNDVGIRISIAPQICVESIEANLLTRLSTTESLGSFLHPVVIDKIYFFHRTRNVFPGLSQLSSMAPKESLSRIVQLARIISASVDEIEDVLIAQGIESPSFDEDATFKVPLELSTQHDAILDATAELHDLFLEPLNLIHRHAGVCILARTQAFKD